MQSAVLYVLQASEGMEVQRMQTVLRNIVTSHMRRHRVLPSVPGRASRGASCTRRTRLGRATASRMAERWQGHVRRRRRRDALQSCLCMRRTLTCWPCSLVRALDTHTRWPTLPLMQVRRAVGWLLAVDAHRIDGPGEMLITRKLTQRLPDSLTYASSEHLGRCLEDVSMLTLAETDALRQEVRGLFFLFDALQTKLLGDPNLPWAAKTRVQQRVHERIMRAEELFESERPEMQGQRSSLRLRP